MKTPTIHLNGTAKTTLLDLYHDAAQRVQDAINSLQDAAPNGRDYYPQGEGAFAKATTEHAARVAALVKVRDEIMEIYQAIDA